MVLVRDRETGPMLALITTDLIVAPTDLVACYAARWAIEVTFFDTRQILGVGQARNRTAQAVTRTWAFGMYVYTIVVLWYAVHGHRSGIVADRRVHAPWYLSKTDPSFADMLTALRRCTCRKPHPPWLRPMYRGCRGLGSSCWRWPSQGGVCGGMMVGRAAATGVPWRDERVRPAASAADERSGQGCGDPGATTPAHGAGTAAGHREGAVRRE
jgi:hypothetical protein